MDSATAYVVHGDCGKAKRRLPYFVPLANANRGHAVHDAVLNGRNGHVLAIDVGSADRLAREVAGYGPDAVVLEPESLRDEVLARLRAQAGQVPA